MVQYEAEKTENEKEIS